MSEIAKNNLVDFQERFLKKERSGINDTSRQFDEGTHDLLEALINEHSTFMKEKKCKNCDKVNIVANKKDEIIMNSKKVLLAYFIFFTISVIFAVVSATLLFAWRISSVKIFEPETLLVFILMGLGWAMTAGAGIKSVGGQNGKY